jgi:hypothetical protein
MYSPPPTVLVRVANVLAGGGVGAVIEPIDICVRPSGSSTPWTSFQPVLSGLGRASGVPAGTVTNYIGVASAAVEVLVVKAGLASCPAASAYQGSAVAQPGYSTVAAAINDAAGRQSYFVLAPDENVVSPARTRLRMFALLTEALVSVTDTAVEEVTPNAPSPLPMPFGSIDFPGVSSYVTFYPSPIPSPTPSPSPTPAPPYLGFRVNTSDVSTLNLFVAAPASSSPYTVFFTISPLLCSDTATHIETTFAATCSSF